MEEAAFRGWYDEQIKKMGQDPEPDRKEHPIADGRDTTTGRWVGKYGRYKEQREKGPE